MCRSIFRSCVIACLFLPAGGGMAAQPASPGQSPDSTAGSSHWRAVDHRISSGAPVSRIRTTRLAELPVAPEPDAGEADRRRERIGNIFPEASELAAGDAGQPAEPGGPMPTEVEPLVGPSGAENSAASVPEIDRRFDGPYDAFVAPPDPVIAVGRDHVVSLINRLIAVYDKQGNLLEGPTSLRDFFGIPSGFNAFDPLAVYDPFSDRFIVVATSRNDSQQDSRLYIAFSQTADATADWNNYFIDADRDQAGSWADYPSIGIDRNAVYLTANMFSFAGFFDNVTLFVYDKEDGYAGRDLDNTHLIDVRTASGDFPFRLRPATVEQTVPGDVFYLMQASNSFGASLNLFRLTGDRFNDPDLSATTVGLPETYSGPGSARQPGDGSPGVDTLGGSLWNVIYRDGTLWTAQAIAASPSIASWVHRVAVDSGGASREETYELDDPDADSFFPYVLPDQEDDDFALLTAFSGPDRHVTGRYWNVSADGTIRHAELLVDSSELNTSDRHGDYFAVAYDPVDRNRVWMIAQFMRDSSFAGNQKIASAPFEGDSAPPAPPPLPDGDRVPGEPVQVTKAGGGEVTITWDAETCPAADNHLVWFDLLSIDTYAVADERCDVGTSGSWTGPPPSGSVAVIVVGDDDAGTEGSHGTDSAGNERPSTSPLCASTKSTAGTCTP